MKMNKFRSVLSAALIFASVLFFTSCDENDVEKGSDAKGVIVVNEGNFGSGDGSISLYSEDSASVTNNVVKTANGGMEIGATVQSLFAHDGVGYAVCNTPDKIEFISMEDFTYLANPETEISTPRYMAVVGDIGYITCWGPYGENFTLPDSYVAVLDLTTRKIIDTLECGSGAEGIIASGETLYVANSYDSTVTVIDLEHETSSIIKLNAAPLHFVNDGSGSLWVTVGTYYGKYAEENVGLQEIKISDNSLGDFVQIANLDGNGKMAIDAKGDYIYVLTAEPYPSSATEVYKFDVNAKTLGSTAFISGENFYGIGVNPESDNVYIGNTNGFAGSGKIHVYDAAGNLVDDQTVSVAPNGFVFR